MSIFLIKQNNFINCQSSYSSKIILLTDQIFFRQAKYFLFQYMIVVKIFFTKFKNIILIIYNISIFCDVWQILRRWWYMFQAAPTALPLHWQRTILFASRWRLTFYLDISSIILSCCDKMSHCSARWLCASVGRAEFAATGAVSSARRVCPRHTRENECRNHTRA